MYVHASSECVHIMHSLRVSQCNPDCMCCILFSQLSKLHLCSDGNACIGMIKCWQTTHLVSYPVAVTLFAHTSSMRMDAMRAKKAMTPSIYVPGICILCKWSQKATLGHSGSNSHPTIKLELLEYVEDITASQRCIGGSQSLLEPHVSLQLGNMLHSGYDVA